MHYLNGKNLCFSVDERGFCVSVQSGVTGHEFVEMPGHIWKLIYAVPGTETVEAAIWQKDQTPEITCTDDQIVLHYDGLVTEHGAKAQIVLDVFLKMAEDGLRAWAEAVNNDPAVELMEIQLTPISGVRSLSGDPENDYLAWPRTMGVKVRNPAFCDLSSYAGFRKYERHDQFHTDMDALYMNAQASMQWYDWYNEEEGLYIGSEDTSRESLCLHVERATKDNVLRFGFISYPMIKQCERYTAPSMIFTAHKGDWHAGARMYRAWIDRSGLYTPPQNPDWARDFTGWLRVILKQHHCECNWTFDDIPALYDETEAAGFKTLYLLGWEEGGFARMWPDFIIDEGALGGAEKLKKGIDYVHSKGGRVLMFLSYLLIDHQSKFYKEEGGDHCTVKSLWNEDIPFSETYCGEGTYRKIGNPPMPMFLACPASDLWHEKMKWAADVCLQAGADGVLYDLGGKPPYFCYATDHGHDKPTQAYVRKAERFADLKRHIRTYGDDKIILMEHSVDIFNQSMDITHSNNTQPEKRLCNPKTAADLEAAKDDSRLLEMYRYTFPEHVMTNRECGEDENAYKAMAGYSFLLGLRFDMTIYRCCGSLKDIPHYTEYLKVLNALYHKYQKHLLRGKFVDTDGFTWNNPYVYVKGWKAEDGTMAVTLWNPTAEEQTVEIVCNGKVTAVTVAAEMADAAEI